MFKKIQARLLAVTLLGLAAAPAFAQAEDNPITTMLASVSLAGVAAGVAAAGLLIVAIAVTFKGIGVTKKVVSRI